MPLRYRCHRTPSEGHHLAGASRRGGHAPRRAGRQRLAIKCTASSPAGLMPPPTLRSGSTWAVPKGCCPSMAL